MMSVAFANLRNEQPPEIPDDVREKGLRCAAATVAEKE